MFMENYRKLPFMFCNLIKVIKIGLKKAQNVANSELLS